MRDRLWRIAWKQALACGKKSALRSVRVGRWTHGVKPLRVTGSGCAQLPLCPQWPRMKSDRGRQYRNASRTGHGEIRPQTRAVSGSAALVTTPLRSPVTRAASHRHARRQAFACHGLAIYGLMPSFGSLIPAHWGPQAPRRAAPPLARELAARVAVAGKAWGLRGQLWLSGRSNGSVPITKAPDPVAVTAWTNARE